MTNTTAWSFLIDYLPDDCQKTAEKELHETHETKMKALKELNSKIKDSNNLNDILFEPDHLIQFLRWGKYNVEKAFGRLKKNINFRRNHPELYPGVPDKISSNDSYRWATPLPDRSIEGSAVMVLKFGAWNTNDITVEDLLRSCHGMFYQALRNPVNQIRGFHVILDFKGTTFKHLLYGSPSNLYMVAQMFLDCLPARFKNYHLVNHTYPMKIAYTIITPFVSEKQRNRVLWHKHPKELLKFIDKRALPVEYGGEKENYYMHDWLKEANYQMNESTLGGQRNLF